MRTCKCRKSERRFSRLTRNEEARLFQEIELFSGAHVVCNALAPRPPHVIRPLFHTPLFQTTNKCVVKQGGAVVG